MYIETGKTQRRYFKSCIVLIEYSLSAFPLSQYIHVHIYIYIIKYMMSSTDKRLNTGMAPTCDWMIKIVKVNKLYLNSLLVSIVNRVSQSRTMKYQCE